MKDMMDGAIYAGHTLASLRNQVALVSQNVHLFNDTVANNIAYARTENTAASRLKRRRAWLYHGLYQQDG